MMKRYIPLVVIFALLSGLTGQAFAAAKIGSSCSKIGLFQTSGKVLLVCDLVKKKKVWRKATAIETKLYKSEQLRIQSEARQKILDEAKAESERMALEVQAKANAEAAQAAADAAAKAAAEKAAVDATAKAAAAKAVADAAAAKAVADAAAAKAAAEVPGLAVGAMYSGIDNDNLNWKWIAVRVTNTATTKVHSHKSFDVLIAEPSGGIVDSTFEPNFPFLAPGQTAWYVVTQFNNANSSQVVFQKKYSTLSSPVTANEIPSTSNARLITSPYLPDRKSVQVTVRNNSSSLIMSKSSTAYAVLFDSAGNPIYAARGFFDKAVLPGGSADITIGDDFTFNGQVSSIQVTIAPLF